MAIYTIQDGQLAFGMTPLLDKVNLQIEAGERLCVVGRNGAGKSTLLKVLTGELALDDGICNYPSDLKVARLEQDPPASSDERVFDYVASGVGRNAELLKQYHEQSLKIAEDPSEKNLKVLTRLQEQLEHQGAGSLKPASTRCSRLWSWMKMLA